MHRITREANFLGLFLILFMIASVLVLSVPTIANQQPRKITPNQEEEKCLVPCDEIVNGGPGKDGIPSIDDPQFYSVSDAQDDLEASDRIVGMEIDGVMYGFPHRILNWHEIANVQIKNTIKSITYCPLTGTAIPFDFSGEIGVSGKLFENNLIMYDRKTDSYWSQMYGQSIKGERLGERASFGDSVETTWEVFSLMYPDAQILTRDTGYNRNYDRYPYARYDYLESNFILFQSSYDASKEPYSFYSAKELTAIVFVENEAMLLPFPQLNTKQAVSVDHMGSNIVILFHEQAQLAMPFQGMFEGEPLQLTRIPTDDYSTQDHFDLHLYKDQHGNIWNMKGQAIDGPNEGASLEKTTSYVGFWFAATAFFGNAPILNGTDTVTYEIDQKIGEFTDQNSATFPVILVPFVLLVVSIIFRKVKR